MGALVADDCDGVAVGDGDHAALEGFDSCRERGRVYRLGVGQLLPRVGGAEQTLGRGGCAACAMRRGGGYTALPRMGYPPPPSKCQGTRQNAMTRPSRRR